MILLKKLKSIYKLLLISILATFTVASSANSIELEGKYLYLQGGMALNDITLGYNGNSKALIKIRATGLQ